MRRASTAICVAALLSAPGLFCEAKKKKKKKAEALDVCETCEAMVVELQKAVKQQVRLKFMGKEEEDPQWEARLNHTCGSPKLAPHCEALVADRKGDIVAALDALVARGEDGNERFMDVPALRVVFCSHDGAMAACHKNHHFPQRGAAEAVDAWFRNDAERTVAAYFLRHGKDRDDAALFVDDVKARLAPGDWWKEAAFQHYTYRFLLDGQDWHRGVDVTLGPAGSRKFEAHAFEPRPGYVELNKPKMIPKPGVDRPDGWDDEEDGPWEPPMVKNPDLKKKDTPYRLRKLVDEEL